MTDYAINVTIYYDLCNIGGKDMMRKTINGVTYDTQRATMDKKFTCGAPGDPFGYEETLYITIDGKYFVYTNGGANSRYPKEDITPIEREKVKDWMLSR